MAREIASLFAISIVLAAAGCGGNPVNRQLLSISISPASASGTDPVYTATGTFNTQPYTVTPLPVSWLVMGPGIDPPGPGYNLAGGTYVENLCLAPGNYTVIAYAPADPNAPKSGPMPVQAFEDLVLSRTATSADGFVASTAKYSCK